MKKEDMIVIGNMRLQGKSAGAIAAALGLSVNTVKSYLRRHPDMGCTHFCPQCGKPVMQAEGRKEKKFCSDQCRSRWWNSHPSEINKKAYYRLEQQKEILLPGMLLETPERKRKLRMSQRT